MSPLRIQAEKSVLKKISIGTLAVLGGAAFAYMGKTNTNSPLPSTGHVQPASTVSHKGLGCTVYVLKQCFSELGIRDNCRKCDHVLLTVTLGNLTLF